MTRYWLLLLCLLLLAAPSLPAKSIIQIESRLQKIQNYPSWLILLRNADDGSVIPWLYDFHTPYWLIFPEGHDYQILASEMRFNGKEVLHNFCDLQDGVLSGKSMQIVLSGSLMPASETLRCHVIHYSSG